MSGHQIQTTDLTLTYGGAPALADISINLEPDRIHGLLGRNGAGKTTLLSALASLRHADRGTILVDGADPFENELLMEQISLIRESGDVLPDERLKVNLDWFEVARPGFDRAYAEDLVDRFGLSLRSRAKSLSRGQASAFGVSVGLATRCQVTMFDEVHLGMDAPARQLFYDELVADFARHPRTILLSTHLISEIEHLLETVTILHRGSLLLSEEADTLRTRGATVTGPTDSVNRFTMTLPVIGSRDLGPTREVVVYGSLDEELLSRAAAEGLQVGGVPLQELFIHLTNDAGASGKEPT